MKIITTLTVLCWPLLFSHLNAQIYQHETYDQHCAALKTLDLGDRQLAYLDIGEGKPILLIHGIPTNSWLYRKMVNPLVAAGYRVIVPDMMGVGQSSTDLEKGELSFEKQSYYLSELATHLKLVHAAMVIHDAGGPWSYNFLALPNCPIDELIVLNTIMFAEGFNPPVRPKNNGLLHKVIGWAYGNRFMSKMMIKTTLKNGLDAYKLKDQEQEGYTDAMASKGGNLAKTFFGSLRDMDQVTLKGQEAIKSKNIKLLSVWGQNDEILIASKQLPLMMEKLGLAPENAKLLAGCNHFIQEEAPEDITKHIIKFLSN